MGTIRELPAEEIEELLRSAIVGRIACCDHGAGSDGRPYLVPLAYGYDGPAIYAHSGPGRKLDFMRREPRVTFEVDDAQAPYRWRSVVAGDTDTALAKLGTQEGMALDAVLVDQGTPGMPIAEFVAELRR